MARGKRYGASGLAEWLAAVPYARPRSPAHSLDAAGAGNADGWRQPCQFQHPPGRPDTDSGNLAYITLALDTLRALCAEYRCPGWAAGPVGAQEPSRVGAADVLADHCSGATGRGPPGRRRIPLADLA